jgi:hypothetical protein
MRRILSGLLIAAALFLVARWVWLAFVPETTRIRWRLEEMEAGFNETRLSPCLRGVAEEWRHADSRVDRALLADILRSVFFHEKDPKSGRFPLHAEFERDSLEIVLDPVDEERAEVVLVGVFSVLDGEEWSPAWRARITASLRKDPERGWQVTASAHEDLQADGRFLGMR